MIAAKWKVVSVTTPADHVVAMAEPEAAVDGVSIPELVVEDEKQVDTFFLQTPVEVTSVAADLFLSLESDAGWDPNQVFAAAVSGIVDALLPGVVTADTHVHTDGEWSFGVEEGPLRLPIDRHSSYLAHKKRKERASKVLGKTGGLGNSRSPSRASSRAQSRVSVALSGSVLAMKMAKLALRSSAALSTGGRDAPFRINDWNDASSSVGARVDKPTGSRGFDAFASGLSSRYSLASRGSVHTPPHAVDYQEVKRRELLSREIETRVGRERLTARLQRIGGVQLKLRSMNDPKISLEREEREAAAKSRAGMRSRGRGAEDARPAATAALARINSVVGSSLGLSARSSNETTYRSEDYEGLRSELVAMDKRGELLVGENCHLVLRKSRSHLQHDMYQKNTIKPRVQFPQVADDQEEGVATAEILPHSQSPARGASRLSPHRVPPLIPQPAPQISPVFEGSDGTFQLYPRIELDPKKTPLAKGVTIVAPDALGKSSPLAIPAASSMLSPLKEVHQNKPKSKKMDSPLTKLQLKEDEANELLESSKTKHATRATETRTKHPCEGKTNLANGSTTQPSVRPTPRTTARNTTTPGVAVLPRQAGQTGKQQLQSLRLRTPAYGNRTGQLVANALLHPGGDHDEDPSTNDWHEAVDRHSSLQTPMKSSANLPKFSADYMREFPSPPKGQIQVASSHAAAALLSPAKASGVFPLAVLSSVVRGKR